MLADKAENLKSLLKSTKIFFVKILLTNNTVSDIVMLYKIIHKKLSKGAYRKRKSAFAFFIFKKQGGISHEIKRHRINFSGHQRQSKQVYDRDL